MLVFRISLRYLIALRKASTVQILSVLSVFGVFLGSMAMLIVLSAFNGFESLLKKVYHYQDPDFRVLPSKGSTFFPSEQQFKELRASPGIAGAYSVISDKASLQYGDGQMVVEVFAAELGYFKICRIDTAIQAGNFEVREAELSTAVISEGIRQSLQVSFNDAFTLLKLSYPKRSKILKPGSGKIFNSVALKPMGSVGMDENRVFTSLETGRRLLDRKSGVSFLDIFIAADADPDEIRKSIAKILGPDVLIKNEYQLHEDLFKVMEIEKLFVFLALGFIILISTFNLFVSSSMMVLNKQKDFTILSALGMEKSMFASIVRTNGLLLTLLGLIPGLIMATSLCVIQIRYGIVPLGMSTTLVKDYPVELRWGDFLAITSWVILAALISLQVPAKRASASGQLRD